MNIDYESIVKNFIKFYLDPTFGSWDISKNPFVRRNRSAERP